MGITSPVNLDEVAQFAQEGSTDSMDSIQALSLSKKNNQLDQIQLTNMGVGLLGASPISSTSGKLNTCIGFDRIDQSFRIILGTVPGEVPMLPILGSQLHFVLFEPIDSLTFDQLELVLEDCLAKLEPRAKILTTNIDDSKKDENQLGVEMEYQLTNTNIVRVFRTTIYTANGGDVL